MFLLGVCTGKILIYRADKAKLACLKWVYSTPCMHDFFLNVCKTWMIKNRVGAARRSSDRVNFHRFTQLSIWTYLGLCRFYHSHGVLCTRRSRLPCTLCHSHMWWNWYSRFQKPAERVLLDSYWLGPPVTWVVCSVLRLEKHQVNTGHWLWYEQHWVYTHAHQKNRPEIPCSNLPALPLM